MLRDAKPAIRKTIIKTGDKELLTCLCECSKNVLKGNVPLTTNQKSHLRRHKRALRELALKKTSKKKKVALIQKGGFLGALLTPILSLLGGWLGGSSS